MKKQGKTWYQTKANPVPAHWRREGQFILKTHDRPTMIHETNKLLKCDRKRDEIREKKDWNETYYKDLFGE